MKQQPPARAYVVLLLGVVAVSWAAIFIRLAEAPALVIAAWRLSLAAIPVLIFAGTRMRRERSAYTGMTAALTVLSGVFLALHFALWIASLQYTSVVMSVVLVTTQPLFVALASPFLLNERPTLEVALGIGLAACGALIMASSSFGDSGESLRGALYATLGAVFAAGYFMIGRHVRGTLSLGAYIGLMYPTAAMILVLAAIVSGVSLFGYDLRTYLMFALLALVPQLIGHSSLNWSLRYFPAAVVTLAVLGEPVGATTLAALVLHEVPTLLQVGGGALVLLGVWLALRQGSLSSPGTVAEA